MIESMRMHSSCSVLPESCCHLGLSSAVPGLIRLQINMSSSYAAAISALITTNSLNPPIKPRTYPSPGTSWRPKPSPPPSKVAHCPPAAQTNPRSPEPLGAYDEQQENPDDYDIGRLQHDNTKLVHTGWGIFFDAGTTLCCRWLLPRKDWRDFCWPLPGA